GTLDLKPGGPPSELSDPQNRRRTLYGIIRRRELADMLRLHDVPDATAHSPGRVPTTTPLQQLFVLNSPFVQEQAAALAKQMKAEVPGSPESRVYRTYSLLFGRPPTGRQMQLASEFLTADGAERHTSWQEY